MADVVAEIRSENANLRRIQNRLVQWDSVESPLAALTQYQTDAIHTLAQILSNSCSFEVSLSLFCCCFLLVFLIPPSLILKGAHR